MASNYRAKFSRSQNLVNLALGNENSSAQGNDLGYENDDFIENSDGDLSSPLPLGASEIFENCSFSLLKDILCFENDPSPQDKQNDAELENSTLVESVNMFISNSKLTQPHEKCTQIDNRENKNNTDLCSKCISVQETNDYSNEAIVSSSSIIITKNNNNLLGKSVFEPTVEHQSEESIQNTDLLDYTNMRDNDNVTPMPSSNYSSFGEEEPIPSVLSLLSNATASSPVSQYYSSSDFSTPTRYRKRKFTKKRDSGRLREKFRDDWIDSKRKILKNSGQAYNSRNGKLRDGKQLGEPCQSTCKLKCFEKLDEGTRTTIFNQFWMIGDHSKQYNFIANYVVRINKKRTVTQGESRRSYTYVYHLPITQNNQKTKLVVCKTMFLNTISCGPKMIRTAMKKFADTHRLSLVDNRGRHDHHKTSVDADMIKSVLDHVKSFEPVDSHYCRKDSNKLYLDGSLSFIRMFKLYKEWYDPTKYDNKCESLRQYRDIVNKNINLSFHQPKKDQCHICHSFKNGPVTPENKINFDNHIINKNLARSLKENDKRNSQSNPKIFCATFDLQKVLLSPSGEISLFYYSKRLKVYNLSVFDIGNLFGTCYLWNEQIAMKGSNEIASCVYNIIKLKNQEGCDDFRFWSDNCTGQNRNRIMFFMYLYAAKQFNLNIKHCFLEVGHTQNEGDSIHATIERASKYKNIYTPSEWSSLIRWAKSKGSPYNVIDITQNMIYDFKKMQTNTKFNWNRNSEGQKILWSKIKQIRVSRDEPFVLYYKYNLDEDSIENNIKILHQSVRTRTRFANKQTDIPLQLCYTKLLPIEPSKKKDLLDLCRKNIIPSVYHSYYENLVTSNDIVSVNDSDNEDN